MQFYHPESFTFLWILVAVTLIFWVSSQQWKKRLGKIGYLPTIQSKLIPTYRSSENRLRALCLLLALLLSIIALARPQWGDEKRQVQRKGIDLIFLLDTSLSMLAEDVKPTRLDKSRLEIKSFIRRLKGDRIGMVAFAGSSFLQTPLTLDYSAFFLFLDAIKSGYIPDPGTSLDKALRLAMKSFPESETKHKAIVLFTDGEDHEGNIESALEEAKKSGIRIYTIGVGTLEGAPIPLKGDKNTRTGFKKDRAGQIVITKLNQPLLEKIATESGALYLTSSPGEREIDLIIRHMASMGEKKIKERLVTEKEDHYQLFLFFAFLFLMAEMLVRRTQSLKTSKQLLMVGFLFLLFSGFFSSPADLNKKGNELYQEKKYQSATEQYQKAKIKKPDDPTIAYNLGTTLYQSQDFQEAARELEKTIGKSKDKELLSQALYNYGNTQYRLGNFEKAIQSFEKALELNPKDQDAKYNLEFLTKEKSQFDKKNEENKENQQKNNQQQNQPQQDQQQQQQQNKEQQQNQEQNQQNQNPQDQGEQNQDQQNQSSQGEPKDDKQEQDQNQDQKDQSQDQNQEQQNQQGEQESEQEKQDSQSQGEDSESQEDQTEQEQQPASPKPEEGDQEQEENQQEQNEQQSPEKQQGNEDQPTDQNQAENQQNQSGNSPLQGQMNMDNALRLLDALKEGEKELQDLRRPPTNPKSPTVEKDW